MGHEPQPFRTAYSSRDGVHTLALRGDLDLDVRPELEALIDQAVPEGPASLILDLSDLTFIDSTGLGLVLLIRAEAAKRGCRLTIVPGPEHVQRVFEMTGLAEVLPWNSQPKLHPSWQRVRLY